MRGTGAMMTMVRKLVATAAVAMTSMLAACTSTTSPAVTKAVNAAKAAAAAAIKAETAAKAAAAAEAAEIASSQSCTAAQLTVGGFGTSGAAGTQVVTIRIEDTSSLPCSLTGYPVVTFLSSAGTPLSVTVSHGSGIWPPGVATLVLPPGEAASAGFIVLSSDTPLSTAQCPTATSISVRLPDMTASYAVDTATALGPGIALCGPASLVDISPVVKGALLEVSPAVTAPTSNTHPQLTPTAVTGADGYLWMLGTYPCESGTCPVLMRSTDGGKSFVRVGTPPPLANALVFANREDGYAYFEGSSEASATLYWTGSGGMTWQLVPLRFAESRSPSIVIASGRAYTLVAEACLSDGECRSQVLASSPVTSDSWTTTALHLPVGEAIQPVGLAAFRSKVWVIGIGGVEGVVLSVSVNGGKSFTNLSSMGLEGLACDATATSASVLWAFCATGSLGYAARSVDGGREFALMPGWNHGYKGDASTAGSIIPLSDNEAVFRSNGPYFYLTRDGGREFSSIWSHNDWNHVYSIAFADTTSWVMLGVSEGPGGNNSLWRTTNGGRTWQPVKAPTVKATTSTARLSGVVTGQTADCTAFSHP